MDDASAFEPHSGAQTQPDPIDRLVAELASAHNGVVAHRELIALGLGRRAIGHRLERGRLHSIHRGVYAVGHRLVSPDGVRRAAVLAGGPDAVLSHRSAAALLGIRGDSRSVMEITVPRSRRDLPGIQQHRAGLVEDEITVIRDIPVTTLARTLLDLAAVVNRRHVERATREAEYLRIFDRRAVENLLTRYPRRGGSRVLRSIIDEGVDMRILRSELERRFVDFLTSAVLPQPETNVTLELNGTEYEIDCLWREQLVALELDSRQAHDTSTAFESDRRRDRALSVAGWRPIRVTWRQLRWEPEALEHDLRTLLASSLSRA